MKSITKSHIEWINTSKLDPTGLLFRYDGEVYRAVYQQSVNKVKHLFDSGIVRELVAKRLLVETHLTELALPGFGLVLHHKKIPFPSHPEDWPRAIFRDAAKTVIKLNIELQKHLYATIDYHAHNVKLDADSNPVWIDFGSIVPQKFVPTQQMHAEFSTWFINILILLSKGIHLGKISRSICRDGGLNAEELHELTGMRVDLSPNDRETWLFAVLEWLENLEFPQYKGEWSDYYTSHDEITKWDPCDKSFDQPNTRRGIVAGLLEKFAPEKIIDLGCNTGLFSVLSSRFADSVCAIDNDEWALDQFYRMLSQARKGLPISLVVRDIGAAQHQQRSPMKADLVLALAITHHLFFTNKLTFDYIAWLLTAYSTDTLITEFMPDGLGIGRPHPDPLPAEYELEKFKNAFRPFFKEVDQITYPSGSSKRIFVVCAGRTQRDRMVN